MVPVYTLSEAKRKDKELIERYQLSESALIDNAAMGAFQLARPLFRGRIVLAIGPGNNGSDGIELASILHEEGYDASVLYYTENGNAENMRRRESLNPAIPIVSSLAGFDTVVEALFGFGIDPGRGEFRTLLSTIDSRAEVIALDVPAGFAFDADATVTFMAPKAEMYLPGLRGRCGRILRFNPGFPEEGLDGASIHLLSDDDSAIRRISIADYKNSRGHVLAIGGSRRFPGALRLLCRAATAAAAGLVTVLTEDERIFAEHPSLMPFSDDSFSRFSSIAIGPGWDAGNEAVFDRAVASGKPMVIDADALKFVHGHRFSHKAVLTPHVGEYRALMASLGIADGLEDASMLVGSLQKASSLLEAVLILKASALWIADGSDIFIYDGANPSLGTAGSGDVLSGIVAALLAQGEDPLRAAVDGVILHQRAGRAAHEEYGYYTAEELIIEAGRLR